MPQEVRLWSNNAERERYENLADLYAIIATTERLEKQYIRDSIPVSEYAAGQSDRVKLPLIVLILCAQIYACVPETYCAVQNGHEPGAK